MSHALQPKCRSAGVLTLSTAPTLVRSFLLAPGADASPASPSLVSLVTTAGALSCCTPFSIVCFMYGQPLHEDAVTL